LAESNNALGTTRSTRDHAGNTLNPILPTAGQSAKKSGVAAPLENNQMMKRIIDTVGQDIAIQMVMQAYNTELITTWLSRLEPGKAKVSVSVKQKDHLRAALERTLETCELAN
jgi:hypothetical protein